jgi:hypothetical protein
MTGDEAITKRLMDTIVISRHAEGAYKRKLLRAASARRRRGRGRPVPPAPPHEQRRQASDAKWASPLPSIVDGHSQTWPPDAISAPGLFGQCPLGMNPGALHAHLGELGADPVDGRDLFVGLPGEGCLERCLVRDE